MARIRSVKPEFWTDERVGECSPNARLLFLGTLNFADDHGGIDRSAKQLKAQVFPYDSIDCEPLIQELLGVGLLIEYEVDGRKYLHIKGFRQHQKVEKPGKPRVPLYEPSVSIPRTLGESSEKTPRGRESKGEGVEGRGDTRTRARPQDIGEPSSNPPRVFPEGSPNASRGTHSPGGADSSPATRAAAACIAMRAEGLVTANPSHPVLLELLSAGAEIGEFVQAARDSVAKRKDFRYALGIVRGNRQDAARLAGAGGVSAKGRYIPAPTTEQMEVDMRVGLRDPSGTWLGPRMEDGTPDYSRPEVKAKLQTVAA